MSAAPALAKVLLLLVSGQTADVALVPIARTGTMSEERAAQIASDVGDVLRTAGVIVAPQKDTQPQVLLVRDARNAPAEVVAYAGTLQDATMALRVEAGELGDRLVIALELLDSNTSESLAQQDFVTLKGSDRASWKADLKPTLDGIFAVTAKRPARPKPQPQADDAPELVELTPPPPKVEAVQKVATPPSRAPYLIPVGVGVGLVGAGAVALMMSRTRYSALTDAASPSLTAADAQRTALEGQSLQTFAVTSFGVGTAAIAAGLALYFWPSSDSELSALAGPGELGLAGHF